MGDCTPQWALAMSADSVGGCNWGRGCYWHLLWGPEVLLNTSQCTGRSPTKNHPSPNVNSAEVGKPCSWPNFP